MCAITIGRHQLPLPLIQGGMGIGVSLSGLAGAVARRGAMGVISGVNPGFRAPDFMENPLAANERLLKEEIQKAKTLAAGRGMVGVNVMVAMRRFREMVMAAVEGGADALICGAGLPLELPDLVPKHVAVAPIVSSWRALRLVLDTWQRRYDRRPDFVVVEGPLAGGHLGFAAEEVAHSRLEDIVADIRSQLDARGLILPLFAAGGIRTAADRVRVMAAGADGIQVGTPFIATHECDVDSAFKAQIVAAGDDDLALIQSPAGFPARAVRNAFLKDGDALFGRCIACLKTCHPQTVPYCISKSLSESAKGRRGLVFSGHPVSGITQVRSVDAVIDELMEDA